MTKKIASILVLCLQLACGVFSTPEPTATPTPKPTSTSTPVPTATSAPTLNVTPVEVPEGGFAILVPDMFDVDIQGNIVSLFAEKMIVSFSGTPYLSSTNSLEDVIDSFLSKLSTDGNELNKNSEEVSISVNGINGIAFDITGTLFGAPIEGQTFAVSPAEDFVIFGIGLSNLTSDDGHWKESGSGIFQGMLDSMTFTDVQTSDGPSGACEISTDSTYGYTQENPIQVGGGAFDGPSRERAYLDNLLGPNGESLSYERQGSTPTDTTILDIYIVTGSGINETLYLDEYNYLEPQAPVGFTCVGEFPLSAP